jgi:hypothetical protein
MFPINREWTKEDYLYYVRSINALDKELSNVEFVLSQVRRFDPQLADLVKTNDAAVRDVIAHVKARLEPKG